MSKTNKILIHITIWLIVIVLTAYNYYLPNWIVHRSFYVFAQALDFIPRILLFYIHYLYLVPHFLMKKKYVNYFLFTSIVVFLNVMALGYLWNGDLYNSEFYINYGLPLFGSTSFVLIISIALKLLDYRQESEYLRLKLEQEVKDTELLFLKSQMSPHFLFNTLNNIYGLSLKNSPATKDAIRQLKDLMTYLEQYENGQKISLQSEINYLNSFIQLNKLRHTIPVNFEIENQAGKEDRALYIEPMILLPFIENSFKHSATTGLINILLNIDNNELNYIVSNNLDSSKRKDTVGGIGIKNVKRRLELLYPNKHHLSTKEELNNFVIKLNIQLL